MKHTPKIMKAMVKYRGGNYHVTVDKYSGNRYKVVAGERKLIGKEFRYGHGLWAREVYIDGRWKCVG